MSETEVGRAAIQAQLERILANPLFRNSKRYPGRDPEYDTNLDPVVRTHAPDIAGSGHVTRHPHRPDGRTRTLKF